MRKNDDLSADLVRSLLDYDPATGICRRGNRRAGARQLAIGGRMYSTGRVIWLIVTGRWPDEINHANRDDRDNRWTNLRERSRSESMRQAAQQRRPPALRGIYERKSGRWSAQIYRGRAKVYLGTFDTQAAARAAYDDAAHQ